LFAFASESGKTASSKRHDIAASNAASSALMPNPSGIEFHPPVEGEPAFVADPIGEGEVSQTVTADVVVCGAGMSGVTCALSASQNGLSVVLLEKGQVFAARGTEVGAIGDRVHAEAGVELDPDQFLADAMATAHFRCDRNVWLKWIQRSGEALDWAMDQCGDACGKFYCVGGNTEFAGVTTWGTGVRCDNGIHSFVEALLNAAVASGVDLRYETPAVQLIQDGSGRVSGVIARDKNGTLTHFEAAKGVVLATGGYEHNWEMICQRCRPRDMAAYAWNNPTVTDTGDGIAMGVAVGAAEDDYPHILMNDPAGALTGERANGIMPAFLRVNANGERFVNESLSFEYMTNAIMYQPGAHDFVIMSGDLTAAIDAIKGGAPWPTEDMIATIEPVLTKADTLEELADACGIDAEGLAKTIERYNELCDAGEDSDFGKNPKTLLPLNEGPYYAVEESGTCLVTVNGLRTNASSEVLDLTERPIAGLYALGNSSGSMFFGTYPHHLSAISHGRCVTFGYLLGRELAGVE
jgi:fumarate reductase flavoprotein subunit